MTSIRTLIALSTLAVAGLAQAQEATTFPSSTMSAQSRSAVTAETRAAIEWRKLMSGTEGPDAIGMVSSSRARDEVRMEAAAARRASMTAEAQARERQLVGM